MGSKYDGFWAGKTEQIRALVGEAASGRHVSADLSDIRPLGQRASWAGSASVRGSSVLAASMAHMVSLGRLAAADSGSCLAWPEETFVFSMSSGGTLTVRMRSAAGEQSIARSAHTSVAATPEVDRLRPTDIAVESDPTEACRAIHDILAGLPRYTDPAEVPFANGLYFFFEAGEDGPHGHPRITRIGNHPHVQDRLVGRLRDHYRTTRDAKNGSVFRRYLGGALLRRDGRTGCLEPGPGQGHWERGKSLECDACAPFETFVTEYLRSHFSFACVRIDDQELRTHLEKRLIASAARCTACRPSPRWLGLHAYSEKVRSSGLWNSDHVDGPGASSDDLEDFRRLARAPTSGTGELADTLLLIRCSAGKRGRRQLGLAPTTMADHLGAEAQALLVQGREAAFRRARLDEGSEPIPAIARYSGQPYVTPGVVDGLLETMSRGMHVVIVSGGYGLVRAEELIQDYEAPMQRTLAVWRARIPTILQDYVDRNGIRRTFGTFSSQYAAAVPHRSSEEDWRAIPNFYELGGTGAAMRVVPEKVADLLLGLLRRNLRPGDGWRRTP